MTTEIAKTSRFFRFDQNNTGGSFIISEDLAEDVFIEAFSATEAAALAQVHGIYFDGVEDGIDCECCGDRWYAPWIDDGMEFPSVYISHLGRGGGEVPLDSLNASHWSGGDHWSKPGPWTPGDKPFAIVYCLNGEVKRYRKNDFVDPPQAIEGSGPIRVTAKVTKEEGALDPRNRISESTVPDGYNDYF